VDIENDAPLSTEEATVVAAVRMTEELQKISGALKDILYFMQNNELQVHQTN